MNIARDYPLHLIRGTLLSWQKYFGIYLGTKQFERDPRTWNTDCQYTEGRVKEGKMILKTMNTILKTDVNIW